MLSYTGLLCFLSAGMAEATTTFNLSTGTATYNITSDSITQAPDSSYTGTAIVITSLPASPFTHIASVTDGTDTSSTWVGPAAAQASEGATVSGTVVYTVSFNLTGFNPATASLIMNVAADDFISTIVLNSTTIFTASGTQISGSMWAAGTSIGPITSGFLAGSNLITFTVDNSTGDGSTSCCGPTGLIAAVDVTATSSVPEPSTLGATGLGLAGLATLLRRRLTR